VRDWKVVYKENRGEAFGIWREPFTELRVPLIFNLRRDPYERAQHNSNTYDDWLLDRVFIIYGANAVARQFVTSFQEFPPSQTPGSFNLDALRKQIEAAGSREN
jgi:arylsulfatase